ncbi:MAG: hypothetical protein WB785_12575 [Mycobacterium sp.]|uniref:hypothetical protein n=1 Tax=Mycobacterium sp. TaxID=1785 RepID=UPI003C4EF4EB
MAVAAGVATVLLNMTGAPAAHADDGSLATDIGLLNSAETNLTDALNVLSQVSGGASGIPASLPDLTSQFEAIQTPLLSSDNSFLSGLGDVLFNGPDQQLAQSSDAFLVAAEAFAADPTSSINQLDTVSTAFQYDDSLLFGALPADVVGKIIDQLLGFDIAANAGADLATGFGLPF